VSPLTGARGAENPLVFAGFVLSNSETGHGSFSVTPRLIAQVCGNGYTITRDAMREVHLGGRLDAGAGTHSHGRCPAVAARAGPTRVPYGRRG
jgi:hypothetical protein